MNGYLQLDSFGNLQREGVTKNQQFSGGVALVMGESTIFSGF